MVVGMLITIVGVHELKAEVDRPRPAGGLVDTEGSSFPSGHAAYSTLYVWLAITLVLRLRPGDDAGDRRGDRRDRDHGAGRASRASISASTT